MTLKDSLFNKEKVSVLLANIYKVYPLINQEEFLKKALASFPKQELKERMTTVRVLLEEYLPDNYITSMDILSKSFDYFTESMFVYGSVLEYIEYKGLNEDFLDFSLDKLGEFTKYFSAEFAIRSFLNEFPEKTLEKVLEFSKSDNPHKRRLASEGVRPSLPWGKNISVDYRDAAKSLDNLYYDTERYVTRSVANHLNDISKIDPEFVLHKLDNWKKSGMQKDAEMNYIIKHSLRTLIKKGHPRTLEFLGYNLNPNIKCSELHLKSNQLEVGEKLEFEFKLRAFADEQIVIDYYITYPTKHNKTTKKVYKLKSVIVSKNNEYIFKGKRSFKEISTRNLYQGTHKITIQVNGKEVLHDSFELNKRKD